MKKLLLLPAFAAIFLASCSNEIDVAAPWKSIPVLYAVLSPQDTAHYIRVEKAFIDPTVSALEIARRPDSLYYPPNEVNVYLQRVADGQRALLNRVDGALEGYPRDGGIFAEQPNWLYKAPGNVFGAGLEAGKTYRILLERTDGQEMANAQTTLPAKFRFRTPDESNAKLTFFPNVPTTLQWLGDANAYFYNVYFVIRYTEQDATTGANLGTYQLLWKAVSNQKREDRIISGLYVGEYRLPGRDFYRFLADNIPAVPNRARFLLTMTMIIEGGGVELKDYFDTLDANSGLTGAEYIPIYSNVQNGLGMVISKNTSTLSNVLITPQTIDSLRISPITQTLNFQ